MPVPYDLAAYELQYFDILYSTPEQLPIRLAFKDVAAARQWRLRWYGFRKALRRQLDSDWSSGEGEEGDTIATRNDRALRLTAQYRVLLEKDSWGDPVPSLVIQVADKETEEIAKQIRAQLSGLHAGLTTSPTLLEQKMDDAVDTLARLGLGTGGKMPDVNAAAQGDTLPPPAPGGVAEPKK